MNLRLFPDQSAPSRRERELAAVVWWARKVLQEGKAVILDTETCGFNAEVIELAIIDLNGATVYNRRFQPLSLIEPGAFNVHGISREMLEGEPFFSDEYDAIQAILGKAELVLIYNADFDKKVLAITCALYGLAPLTFTAECLMKMYAISYGQIGRSGSYVNQKLNGQHNAVGDCQAALKLLQEMARRPEGLR